MGTALVLAGALASAQTQLPAEPTLELPELPGRYVIVLDDDVRDPARVAGEMARVRGLEVGFVYNSALKGFSAIMSDEQVTRLRADGRVDHIEPDAVVKGAAPELPWGVDRVDADLSSTRAGNGAGTVKGVNAYVIDSGIANNPDLNLVNHVNFTGGQNSDCNGHGTHVAGTLAARDNRPSSDGGGLPDLPLLEDDEKPKEVVVGVAPGAPLIGVKVLNCKNVGTLSGVIKGIDWVTANAKRPAVANLSLIGAASKALDDAVRRSASRGIFYSVAAGNNGKDACKYSPARAGANTNNGIVTVAATDRYDRETSWSNYGSCVDIWAPGENILSTAKGGGTMIMSGTSMASPHVGGGGALYRSTHPNAKPSSVEAALKGATKTPTQRSKDRRTIKLENVGRF